MPLSTQFAYLVILALPVACVAWTVTHEEVFREPREWCKDKSQNCHKLVPRKFFYLFTCEFCFSHYVAAFFIAMTRFTMLYPAPDWRGFFIAWLALVWIATQLFSGFAALVTSHQEQGRSAE